MNRTPYILYSIALLLIGAAAPLHAQTIRGKIYGGGQLAAVDGNTKVQVNSGTIGSGTAFDGGVFGGGLGEPTIVTGDVEVIIGKTGSAKDAAGPTINGDVYGGSALGNTNCSAELVGTDSTTSVTLNAGTINGSMYGGALGQKNGVGGATRDIAANVYGVVQVDVNGGIVLRRNGDTGGSYSGGIYGCNNWNGSPQTTVNVDIYHHNSAHGEDKYALFAVYGGGNQANYVGGTPNVTVHYCDNNIEYVYGGGNAAHLTHATAGNTNVIIWGCDSIGNVFGGGNGQVQAANVSGDTNVTIHGGKILNVFGGSNTNGMIGGATNVEVLAQAEPAIDPSCTNTMDITNVYGGGNRAAGKSGTVSIACTGAGTIDNVYGGANMADLTGDIELNIRGGQIANVFGGNNNSGNINGTITVNVNWDTDACDANSLTNVYGGGNLAPYYAYGYDVVDGVWTERTPDPAVAGPTVNLINGTVSGYAYGGGLGEAAVVTGNPTVKLIGATVTNDIFGGGDAAPVTGNPHVNANYGTVRDIFAGGRGATAVVTGNPLAYVNQAEDPETHTPLALTLRDVYGGGDAANVNGTAGVKMDKGTVNNIYGGGNAADVVNTDVVINGGVTNWAFAGGHGNKTAEPQTEANVSGDAHLTVHGGTIERVFAGSNSKGTITGEQLVTIVKATSDDPDAVLPELRITEVYGGGNEANGKAGTFDIGCTGGETEGIGDLFGGAREANITGDIAFTIEGGKIDRIFGGNNVSGNVDGSITVNIAENTTKYDCGLHTGYVYGGGQDAPYAPTALGAYPVVNIIGGSIEHDVFGGGLGAGATVTSNPTVTISGGTVAGNVFGGGSLAETDGNPTVNVTGGTVTHDVYGGGALADVAGNTTVNLTGGAVGGAYGGALGQLASAADPEHDIPAKEAIAAYVNGSTTVTLNGTKITETGVFGANNQNGTPKGHVKVHVLSTTHRDGQASPYNQEGEGTNSYDVPAVYGGGNLSAYEPTDPNDYAEVLIENCDNSIEYVYGGGNAAPVPATQVTIHGANAINHAFAGGNGAGAGNPGADIGYLGYYSSGNATEYGTGKSSITVTGGTVHNVYGGSNTLGYIRGGTTVSVEKEGGACPLNVGNVYGGGNEADIDCDVTMNLDCSEGGAILYAGANQANVNGNITLNIFSGTYGQVFCGNNTSGCIKGNLVVNVDETGCWPVMIGELYACGNKAPYSVYGYDGEGNILTEGTKAYNDPVVNLISFTRIGKVFGGGYGNTAVLYGNTHVNVEPIKGKFAGYDGNTAEKQISPAFVLNGNDERVPFAEATTLPYGITKNGSYLVIPDEAGSIGSIYGGGNAGAVYGNTNVNIGLLTKNKHISGTDTTTEEEVAVTITGDVFGGGNEAIVSGDTKVKIGE